MANLKDLARYGAVFALGATVATTINLDEGIRNLLSNEDSMSTTIQTTTSVGPAELTHRLNYFVLCQDVEARIRKPASNPTESDTLFTIRAQIDPVGEYSVIVGTPDNPVISTYGPGQLLTENNRYTAMLDEILETVFWDYAINNVLNEMLRGHPEQQKKPEPRREDSILKRL